jgi:hypothetical protein
MSNLSWMQRTILQEETMQFLKKYGPSILPLVGGAITFLIPSMQAFIAANPKSTAAVLLGCIIAAHNMTAPKDQNIVNR